MKFYLERVVSRDSALDVTEGDGIAVYLESGQHFQTPMPPEPGNLVIWVEDDTLKEKAVFEFCFEGDEVVLGRRLQPFLPRRLEEARSFLEAIPDRVLLSLDITDCRKLKLYFDRVKIAEPQKNQVCVHSCAGKKFIFVGASQIRAAALKPNTPILVITDKRGNLLAVFNCLFDRTCVGRGMPLGFTLHFMSGCYLRDDNRGPWDSHLELPRGYLERPDWYGLRIPETVPESQLEEDSLALV